MAIRQSATDLQPELTPSELNAIKSLLLENPKSGQHLEIGTAAGGTLREMMCCYSQNRPNFVVVDPFTYFPDQFEIVKRNLRNAGLDPNSIEFRKGYSWPQLKTALLANETFDFIFIDGHHGASHVMEDLRWTRLLQPDGFVCLHDYQPKFPGVKWATERFLKRNSNYVKIAHVDTLVILQKNQLTGVEVDELDLLAGRAMNKVLKLKRSILKRLGLLKAS